MNRDQFLKEIRNNWPTQSKKDIKKIINQIEKEKITFRDVKLIAMYYDEHIIPKHCKELDLSVRKGEVRHQCRIKYSYLKQSNEMIKEIENELLRIGILEKWY